MWNRNPFTAGFALEYPIVQGPFGGGNASVALASAVSDAGALGSLGAVNLSPTDIRDTVLAIKARTSRAFNINLWIPIAGQDDARVTERDVARSVAHVHEALGELGLVRDAARRGIKTVGTATTVDEAVAIEAAGLDAVVASGADAGGRICWRCGEARGGGGEDEEPGDGEQREETPRHPALDPTG